MLKQTVVFRVLSFALLMAVVGLLAACGDSDESTASETQTKKAYIQAADVICVRENAKIRAQALKYQKEHGFSKDPEKQQELIKSIIIPAQQGQVTGLKALDPPDEDQDEAESFIELFEEVIEKTEENPPLVLEGTGPYQELREAAQAFGFKACGQ